MPDLLKLLARSQAWVEVDEVQGYYILEGHLPGTGRLIREVVDIPDMAQLISDGKVTVSDESRLLEMADAARTLKPVTIRYYRVTGN